MMTWYGMLIVGEPGQIRRIRSILLDPYNRWDHVILVPTWDDPARPSDRIELISFQGFTFFDQPALAIQRGDEPPMFKADHFTCCREPTRGRAES